MKKLNATNAIVILTLGLTLSVVVAGFGGNDASESALTKNKSTATTSKAGSSDGGKGGGTTKTTLASGSSDGGKGGGSTTSTTNATASGSSTGGSSTKTTTNTTKKGN